jgi:hypothetical protein
MRRPTARPNAVTTTQEPTGASRSLIRLESTLSWSRRSDDAPAISGMPENRFVVEDLESRRPRTSHSAEKWTFDRSPESRPGRRYLGWTPASVFDERPAPAAEVDRKPEEHDGTRHQHRGKASKLNER